MTVDVWTSLEAPGSVEVVDALSHDDFVRLPARTPLVQRCDLDVVGHHVNLSWREQVLVAALTSTDASSGGSPDPATDIVTGSKKVRGEGDGSIVWQYRLMPLRVVGEPVTVERVTDGRDRWALDVTGPEGRSWHWRPGGRLFADRMELYRSGAREPVVVHLLRPAPGHPRSPAGQPAVSWTSSASLAEVLMPVMWVLDRAHLGLLPKAQRVARWDFL